MFAADIKLSFPKPKSGESNAIYVNGHHIFLICDDEWDNNKKDSWIKFYLNETRGSKVTFEKPLDRGYQMGSSTPEKAKAKEYDIWEAVFLDLESFVFYEDGNKFIVEIK